MPFKKALKKKHYKKKFKPAPKSRWQIYGGAAKQLWSDVIKLKQLVNTEEKIYDSAFTYTVTDNNGILYNLCTPAVGTSAVGRIGDSIKCQRSSLRLQALVGTKSCLVRVIVFEDKQAKVTSSSNLLDPSAIGGQLACVAPKTYDNRFETKILFDKVIKLDSNNAIQHFEVDLHLGHHTTFDAGTTSPVTGAYKMLVLSDQPVATAPEVSHWCRTYFTDN